MNLELPAGQFKAECLDLTDEAGDRPCEDKRRVLIHGDIAEPAAGVWEADA